MAMTRLNPFWCSSWL